jgi:hypothetical protein
MAISEWPSLHKKGVVAYGKNGTTLVALKTNSNGELQVNDAPRQASAFETIIVSNAHAEILTVATYGAATKAIITVETNPVRVRWDGTAPTTAIGHLCAAGSTIEITDHDITHFKAIATGADATLSITYSVEA